ncbi:MAG: fibronectin type III domain-containing protein, partial [bacterium]|nr:fibronectin type III domain-containing protein [bacterium]
MNRLWLLTCVLALGIGCGGGGGGGGTTPAPNPAVTPPTEPSGVATTIMSATSIRVTWVDNSSNEDGFTIEYLIPPATTFQAAGTLAANATQFAHSGLTPSTNYVYRVKATNTGGTTISTNQGSGTTSAAPVTAPAAPSTLGAQAATSTQINLVWVDNANNEDGFKVESSTSSTTGFTQIGITNANVTVFSATGLTASTQYYFRVRAYNTATSPNSAYSNTANATTQAASSGGSGTWSTPVKISGNQSVYPNLTSNRTSSVGVDTNGVLYVKWLNAAIDTVVASVNNTTWSSPVVTPLVLGLQPMESSIIIAGTKVHCIMVDRVNGDVH